MKNKFKQLKEYIKNKITTTPRHKLTRNLIILSILVCVMELVSVGMTVYHIWSIGAPFTAMRFILVFIQGALLGWSVSQIYTMKTCDKHWDIFESYQKAATDYIHQLEDGIKNIATAAGLTVTQEDDGMRVKGTVKIKRIKKS